MKGILFKPDMIKAIVEGRKTVTRRVMKPQPNCKHEEYHEAEWKDEPTKLVEDNGYWHCSLCGELVWLNNWKGVKPRYQVGETVYIKEAWAYGAKNQEPSGIIYRLDGTELPTSLERGTYSSSSGWGRWVSPLFLPEKYARYFIKITYVSAGRVQEITEPEVDAEGLLFERVMGTWKYADHYYDLKELAYAELWDFINPKYPYSSNPWDFRYEFKLAGSNPNN